MKTLFRIITLISLTTLSSYSFSIEPICPGGSNPDPNVIFCDSFENQGSSINEPATADYYSFTPTIGQFNRVSNESIDGNHSLEYIWNKSGDVRGGYFQLNFGANPLGSNITPNKHYREIYWRFYVKLPQSVIGYPSKLTRARGFANSSGADSMVAHIWTDGPNPQFLKIDPVSGIQNNQLMTTRWNDIPNFTWLGAVKDTTPFPKGEWVCIEAHVKLNDASSANGTFDLSINDKIVASRTGLDWVGSWNDYAINAILFSNYWNEGASADNQMRYLDAIVVSEAKIGCITTLRPSPPTNLTELP